jgi:hypothetical protein
MGGSSEASIITWLVVVRLFILVDKEHGTGMDCIVSAPSTYSVTQVS